MRAFAFLLVSTSAIQALATNVQIFIRWKHSPQSAWKTISGPVTVPDDRAQYVIDNVASWSNAKYRGVRLSVGTYRVANNVRLQSRAAALEAWNECERIILGHVGGVRKREGSLSSTIADADRLQIFIHWKHPQSNWKSVPTTITIPTGRTEYVLENIEAWSQARYRGIRLSSGTNRVMNAVRLTTRAEGLQALNECERIILGHVGGVRKREHR